MYKGFVSTSWASIFVAEYNSRKRLAELGFTSPISELSALKSVIFVTIDAEIQKIQEEEMKARANKRGK